MKWNELKKQLSRNGWQPLREAKGSHQVWHHPEKPGITLIVANHGSKEVGTGLANKILKDAGLK